MLVNATNMLLKARDGHYAVGQFNINNLEWTKSILLTAQEMNSPVILGVSEGAGKYMTGFKTVAAAGSKRRRECPVRQWHGSRSAQQCNGQHKDRSPCTMYLLRFYCTTAGPVAQSLLAAHSMGQHSKKGAAG